MLPLSVKLRALESAQDEEVLAAREASWLRRFAGVIGHGRDDVVSVPRDLQGSAAARATRRSSG